MRRGIIPIMCFVLMVSSIAAEGEDLGVQVHVTEEHIKQDKSPDWLRCQFEVTNHLNQGLVTFGVGSNVDATGPFELAARPTPSSPNGWSDNTLTDPNSGKFAVDWGVTEYANALEPGGRVSGFEFRIPSTGLGRCASLHWKAVTRESEVLSGVL